MFDEGRMFSSYSSCSFLLPPVTFSLLQPNILLTTLFSHNVYIRIRDLNFGHFPSFRVTEKPTVIRGSVSVFRSKTGEGEIACV